MPGTRSEFGFQTIQQDYAVYLARHCLSITPHNGEGLSRLSKMEQPKPTLYDLYPFASEAHEASLSYRCMLYADGSQRSQIRLR